MHPVTSFEFLRRQAHYFATYNFQPNTYVDKTGGAARFTAANSNVREMRASVGWSPEVSL